MKKEIYKILLITLVLMVLPLVIKAEVVEVNGLWFDLKTDGTAEMTHHPNEDIKYEGNISIPDNIIYNDITYTVTRIGYHSFSRCPNVDTVVVPNSVTSIATYAFTECHIKSVILGNGITEMDRFAFNISLDALYLSDVAAWCNIHFEDARSNPISSTQRVYLDGEEIQDLVIPEGVSHVKDFAFYSCQELRTVTFPNSLRTIGSHAFEGSSCQGKVTLPDNLILLGNYAFSDCSGITSVSFGKGLTSLADNVFQNCSGITSVQIPDLESWCNLEYRLTENYHGGFLRNKHLFMNGEEVTDIVIPSGITAIADYAFADYNYIKSVVVSNDVQTIGKNAFNHCSALQSVTLGKKVASIGGGAFVGSSITEVTLPDNIISIGNSVFSGCRQLKTVTISNSLDTIPAYTFKHCVSLATINWGSNLKHIKEEAFYECTGLLDLEIPSGIQTIYHDVFRGCNFANVTIPETVYFIGGCAFAECKKIKNIYCRSGQVPLTHSEAFIYDDVDHITLYVPETSLEDYKNAVPWLYFDQIKPLDDITAIEHISSEILTDSKGHWFTIDGLHLPQKPVKKGVYIQNGKIRVY